MTISHVEVGFQNQEACNTGVCLSD